MSSSIRQRHPRPQGRSHRADQQGFLANDDYKSKRHSTQQHTTGSHGAGGAGVDSKTPTTQPKRFVRELKHVPPVVLPSLWARVQFGRQRRLLAGGVEFRRACESLSNVSSAGCSLLMRQVPPGAKITYPSFSICGRPLEMMMAAGLPVRRVAPTCGRGSQVGHCTNGGGRLRVVRVCIGRLGPGQY